MATTTRTFTFNTDAEGWTFVAGGAESGARLNNRLQAQLTGRNAAATGGYWQWTGTYENLGVPAGAIVTGIASAGYSGSCIAYLVVDICRHDAFTLNDGTLRTLHNGTTSYTASGQTTNPSLATPITGLSLASTTSVTLRIGHTLDNGNNKDATAGVSVDDVFVTVSYDPLAEIDQASYRWRNDDGSETAATWLANADTPAEINIGSGNAKARLRMLIRENLGVAKSFSPQLEMGVEGGNENVVYTTHADVSITKNCIAYGDGVWVAVGLSGNIMTATDPTGTWTLNSNSSFGTTEIYCVAYGNGVWVAAGIGGKLATATDPTGTWTQRESGHGTAGILVVAYGNGVWAAGGTLGKVSTATDPTGTWTLNASAGLGTAFFASLAYGNGVWVAGMQSTGAIFTATDPTGTWTERTSNFGSTVDVTGVAYGNGVWVAVAEAGQLATATDPTGTWTRHADPTFGVSNIEGVTYANGIWKIVGSLGKIASATDPTDTWTNHTLEVAFALEDIVFADGVWVTFFGSYLLTGIGWAYTNVTGASSPVKAFNSTYLTAGGDTTQQLGSGTFVTDNNGVATLPVVPEEWTLRSTVFGSSDNVRSIAYGNGYWVAVTANGKLATATDPKGTWTLRTSSFGTDLIYGVAYGNGYWVAVGGVGKIATATDPTGVWTQVTNSFLVTDYISGGVAYNNGVWVAAASDGKLATATDPTSTWTQRTSSFGVGEPIAAVAYGNGYWVAVGSPGKLATATDPTGTWTQRTSGVSSDIYGVAYGDGYWAFVGSSGLSTATDPTGTWTHNNNVPVATAILRIAYGDGAWAITSYRSILTATNPTGTWTTQVDDVDPQKFAIVYANGEWVCGTSNSGSMLTSLHGTFDVGPTAFAGMDEAEYEWPLEFIADDLAGGDTVRFRISNVDTYYISHAEVTIAVGEQILVAFFRGFGA